MGHDQDIDTGNGRGLPLDRWIIDSATDFAIMATDHTGKVTSWSTGATRILG